MADTWDTLPGWQAGHNEVLCHGICARMLMPQGLEVTDAAERGLWEEQSNGIPCIPLDI